jgi:peptide methionine sulfoxide reductase MsrB
MKVKCNKCNKIVNEEESIPKELGIDKDDYVKIYLCPKCRKELMGSDWELDWGWISRIPALSEEFVEKYKDKLNWYSISKYQKLSEEFIEKYKDKVDWGWISFNQKLSEQFIEKYKDKVDWYWVSFHQKLSEQFIEKYKDKVNWCLVNKHQELYPGFVLKHIDKITEEIFYNPCFGNYPMSVKLLLKQKFDK